MTFFIVMAPLYAMCSVPVWLEADSAKAIEQRMASDFSLGEAECRMALTHAYPMLDDTGIDTLIINGTLESAVVNGERMFHKKSVRNLALLDPSFGQSWKGRGGHVSEARMSYADSVIEYVCGNMPDGGAHKVTMRFTIDVPYNPVLDGDTVRVWMPLPISSQRQGEVRLLSVFPDSGVVFSNDRSVHNSVYVSAPVVKDEELHFGYECEFVTRGEYHHPDTIRKHILPYDICSEDYCRYTAIHAPHIVRLDSMANAIVGDETNPFEQSELVYDYITSHFPWAGAREYSTIPCIPEYTAERGYGDCGQVALLYISLMRTLGVPARWESGWMLHPGEKNLHDWAEVYFEGVGWVPVDVSFGRYSEAYRTEVRNFYSTGIDAYRFAANKGIGGELYPPKQYLRSDTVDFQLGEVESSQGNMFYPGWKQHLYILKITPYEI